MARRWFVAIALLVVAALVVLALHRSVSVTLQLFLPPGAWQPLALLTEAPAVFDTTIAVAGHDDVQLRIVEPVDADDEVSAMVLYTPLIGGGIDDERLVNLAETFARAGFVVALPWREHQSQLVNVSDAEDVVVASEYVLERYAVESFGLFGMSYGTGPVFAAAADERIKDTVDFIVSLNGMADLAQVISFIESGEYSYQDVQGHITPHSYPQEVLEANLAARGVSLEGYLASEAFGELRATLSPALLLDLVDAELFIAHSASDTFIPFTESLRLHDVAGKQLESHLVITDVLDHGVLRPFTATNLWRYYVPALLDFHGLIRGLLAYS